MKQRLRKWKCDRLRDQVIANGKKLRQAQVSRAGVSADLYPHDTAFLDAEIDRLQRRHSRLLTKFKEAH
jgi:hypothetical protein